MEADISILLETGHFYFALTRRERREIHSELGPSMSEIITHLWTIS